MPLARDLVEQFAELLGDLVSILGLVRHLVEQQRDLGLEFLEGHRYFLAIGRASAPVGPITPLSGSAKRSVWPSRPGAAI